MPYKDKERRKQYQRDWQRSRRVAQGSMVKRRTLNLQPETARGLLGVLSSLIKEVLEAKEGDIFMRARTADYLISIGLRAVEVADLEGRLEALEDYLGGDTHGD